MLDQFMPTGYRVLNGAVQRLTKTTHVIDKTEVVVQDFITICPFELIVTSVTHTPDSASLTCRVRATMFAVDARTIRVATLAKREAFSEWLGTLGADIPPTMHEHIRSYILDCAELLVGAREKPSA